jgi:hypothetical protein
VQGYLNLLYLVCSRRPTVLFIGDVTNNNRLYTEKPPVLYFGPGTCLVTNLYYFLQTTNCSSQVSNTRSTKVRGGHCFLIPE